MCLVTGARQIQRVEGRRIKEHRESAAVESSHCSCVLSVTFNRWGGWTTLTNLPDKSGPGGLEEGGGRPASTDRFPVFSLIREGNAPTSFSSQWKRKDDDARAAQCANLRTTRTQQTAPRCQRRQTNPCLVSWTTRFSYIFYKYEANLGFFVCWGFAYQT